MLNMNIKIDMRYDLHILHEVFVNFSRVLVNLVGFF